MKENLNERCKTMPKKRKAGELVPFQIRIEEETLSKLRRIAENSEMSLNQLVTGFLRGCADNVVYGEPIREFGAVKSKAMAKCLFLGRLGTYSRAEYERLREFIDHDQILEQNGLEELPPVADEGAYWFSVDYTSRGYTKHL